MAGEEEEEKERNKKHKKFSLLYEEIQDELDDILQFTTHTANKATFHTFEGHMDSLTDIQTRFSELKNDVIEFNSEVDEGKELNFKKENKKISDDISTIKGKFFQIKSEIKSQKANNSTQSQQVVGASAASNKDNLRLDKIKLKTFNGEVSKWLGYYEVFYTLVDQSSRYSDLEKFQYLISSLEGEPLKIVERFEITAVNYSLALAALKKRYDSKRLLLGHLTNSIVNYKPVKFNLGDYLHEHQSTHSQLQKLKSSNLFDDFFFQICYMNLPYYMKSKVDDHFKSSNSVPKLDEFFDYILTQTQAVELRNDNKVESRNEYGYKQRGRLHSFVNQVSHDDKQNVCVACKEHHGLFKCNKFLSKSVDERFVFCKENNVCFNCLRVREKNHSPCSFQKKCKSCNKSHNTLLHKDNFKPSDNKKEVTEGEKKSSEETNNSSNGGKINMSIRVAEDLFQTRVMSITGGSVILGTIRAFSKNEETGKGYLLNCLFDPCSQTSLIKYDSAKLLGLEININEKPPLIGVNEVESESLGTCEILLYKNKSLQGFALKVTVVVVQEITSPLPAHEISYDEYNKLPQGMLADPLFYESKKVNVLLGGDIFSELVDNPRKGSTFIPGRPAFLYTKFGYVAIGKSHSNEIGAKLVHTTRIGHRFHQENKDDQSSTDEIIDSLEASEYMENFYKSTTRRENDGRYSVALPFKDGLRPGKNDVNALQRFFSLERKLSQDKILMEKHHATFKDYLALEHMSKVQDGKYFIPYHYVIQEFRSTTPYRGVFDAGSHASGERSLNDCLYKGANLYNDLSAILMRFQLDGRYTLTADISKCYRRIKVREEDAAYQCCFYRDENNGTVQIFQIDCLVFGVKSSPYLALRTMHQLIEDEGKPFPLASQAIKHHFYMDDCCLSRPTKGEIKDTSLQLDGLLSKGHLPIHKFDSNAKAVLDFIPEEKRNPTSLTKILGLRYDSSTDEFCFEFNDYTKVATKRAILSYTASIFDPQGFLQPLVFRAKDFISQLWKDHLTWDVPVDCEALNKWQNFIQSLKGVKIRIPRYIPMIECLKVFLIGVGDASQKGIAACVYVQCLFSDGKIHTQLLKSKSQVAKGQKSIPNLELSAAVLLSQLVQQVLSVCKNKFDEIFLYSDSQVVLSWIASYKDHSVYVENRLKIIRKLTQGFKWAYIKSEDNPADLATRGLTGEQFIKQQTKWFYGPECFNDIVKHGNAHRCFITVAKKKGPTRGKTHEITKKIKTGKEIVKFRRREIPLEDFCLELSSRFTKLVRVHAYVLRFLKNYIDMLRKKRAKPKVKVSISEVPTLTVDELEAAERSLARLSQAKYFSKEIKELKEKGKMISHLVSLNPTLDNGILVVGGRLARAGVANVAKHPIIISGKCAMARTIIDHVHKRFYHAGPNLTLALSRQQFWITKGKILIKQVIKECNRCRRFTGTPPHQIMSDLPKERVNPSRPFSFTGCDVGGPIVIKSSRLRKAPQIKAYFVVFVCFATKAVHIEALTELSTECFLAAFKRFTSRRGLPKCMFSDCGTNFVGAKRQLAEVYEFFKENTDSIFSNLALIKVDWKLNPPSSPHMGGIWERQVRSIKEHLYKQLNPHVLTFEEFYTVLCFVEAILNSRPLMPIDDNPESLDVLTPAHFLIGGTLVSVPEEPLDLERTMRTRWKLVQQQCQAMWNRWKVEYLHQLQTRTKWQVKQDNLKVGQIVYITDINAAPLYYPMGRIIEVIPSTDGKVRAVKIKTASGTYVRPIVKVIPLVTDRDYNSLFIKISKNEHE